MNKYNTNQKKEILELLKKENTLLSVKEIYELLSKTNNKNNVGLTTIYRYIKQLEKENKIKKYTENGEYKYLLIADIDSEDIYIKCGKCNKIIYFDCNEIKEINKHLQSDHSIILDFAKSSLIGKCVDCKRKFKGGKYD